MSNHTENNPAEFFSSNTTDDLKSEKVDALVERFDDIGNQSQILQGRILIELYARSSVERMTFDEFAIAEGIDGSTLCALTHQHRNRLMNLARFFTDERPMTGISMTVGYEISAPKNDKVAEQVYKLALGQNYSVEGIKKLIEQEKLKVVSVGSGSETKKTRSTSVKVDYSKKVTMTSEAKQVMDFVRDLKPDNFNLQDALVLFKTCYAKIQEDIKGNVIEGTVTA